MRRAGATTTFAIERAAEQCLGTGRINDEWDGACTLELYDNYGYPGLCLVIAIEGTERRWVLCRAALGRDMVAAGYSASGCRGSNAQELVGFVAQ
ncbi:MAG: hypothetical protein AB7P69_26840 [Candidatus Binatia bacterium]